MPTHDIRPKTIHIAEQAAWKQIKNLQRAVFETSGLPGVMELNELLAKNYQALAQEWPDDNPLLARGMAASIFITDFLPQIEREIADKVAVSLLVSDAGGCMKDLAA